MRKRLGAVAVVRALRVLVVVVLVGGHLAHGLVFVVLVVVVRNDVRVVLDVVVLAAWPVRSGRGFALDRQAWMHFGHVRRTWRGAHWTM